MVGLRIYDNLGEFTNFALKFIFDMIQSMTGYGKATAETGSRKVIVEIKSLNSKAMDISAKIIPAYRDKELDIRSRITAALERGKAYSTVTCSRLNPLPLRLSTGFRMI